MAFTGKRQGTVKVYGYAFYIFASRSFSKKSRAASHGPKVCELDGPTPIFSMSNTLMDSIFLAVSTLIIRFFINFQR
jgi:hypothetical protein